MLHLTRLKRIFKKLGRILILALSSLLVLGCALLFWVNNLFSFVFSILLPILLVLNVIFGFYWLIKKSKYFLFSIFSLILYFLCFDSFLQFNINKSADFSNVSLKDNNTLSLLSFNTDGFKHEINNTNGADKQIINFIKNQDPDVFCIQEFSAVNYKYFNDYPYFYKTNIFTQNKSVMAIFSKYPIIDKGYINFSNSFNGAMYVDLDINEKTIRVYNLHLESYKMDTKSSFNYFALIKRINNIENIRRKQAIKLKNHIDNYQGKVIISGDFNSTQFSTTYRILKGSRKDSFIEAGFGFGKTYELLKYPFRLDYILVDDSFEILSHDNFDLKLSDHEPILTKFTIK